MKAIRLNINESELREITKKTFDQIAVQKILPSDCFTGETFHYVTYKKSLPDNSGRLFL
jgi:hypothetical protein